MNEIIQGDCLIEMQNKPDKSVQLIIIDPPYFETKGEFDFIWSSFDEYLQDVEKWAVACKRVLADNGTMFWFGSSKRIAYSQVILDKYFKLINNLVWNKGVFMGLEESEGLRSFAPCTERILMYQQKNQVEFICDDIRSYLIKEKQKSGLTLTDLNEILTGKRKGDLIAKRYFGTSQWELPTKEMYQKLQTTKFFQKEYEDLRKEYEDLRRPFSNKYNLQEILNFSNESQKTGVKIDHDTVKPIALYTALIETCSREGDLVLDPMAGSGTTGVVCKRFNRKFVLIEKEPKYVEIIKKRLKQEKSMFEDLP